MIGVVGGVLLILAAGAAVMVLHRHPSLSDAAYRLLLGAGCAMGAVPALRVLVGSAGAELAAPIILPAAMPGGPWIFGIDELSALFLLIIFGVGGASAFYGVSYLARERPHRFVAGAHASLAVLIAALALVVTARAALPFLIGWEVMALSSYVLIEFEHQRAEVRRAGMLYIVVTHTSMLALCALFAVWGNGARDLTFAALAEHAPALASGGTAVLLLAIVGFGLKAGLVPFHIWLPEAHAAAPSHVSAYMSGVVIKLGIYGLLRVVAMIGAPAAWWGWVVLGLGAASAVLGVIWALAQHDIKRLLAYHSVENIGIILIGIGAGVLGAASGHPVMAVLGFAGAALHTLNHSLFKTLLFLGAGSAIHATGTRDIDRLGGLARRMPFTTTVFLIGSIAIVGLPPLNGFVSEWIVFRALLQGGLATDAIRIAVLGAAALALAGALALACFTKVVGIVFLGSARDQVAGSARESPRGMLVPMAALAGACMVIGILPMLVLPALLRVGTSLASGAEAISLAGDPALAGITLFALALGLGILLAMSLRAFAARTLRARGRPSPAAPTWGCAVPQPTARMQYTASSFAAPLMLAFRSVAGLGRASGRAFATQAADPVLAGLVLPVWHGLRTAAGRLRPIQHGRLALYLLYIAAAVTILLLYLVFAVPGAR